MKQLAGMKMKLAGKKAKKLAGTPRPVDVFDHKGHAEEQYNKNYEFQKKPSGRSPSSSWDMEAMRQTNQMPDRFHPNETAMAMGKPHGFGHGVGQRAGALRLSGSHGAHQIGKKR